MTADFSWRRSVGGAIAFPSHCPHGIIKHSPLFPREAPIWIRDAKDQGNICESVSSQKKTHLFEHIKRTEIKKKEREREHPGSHKKLALSQRNAAFNFHTVEENSAP